MLAWDKEGFHELEDRIMATVAGKRPVKDVPYYYFLYDPRLELLCLKEFRNLLGRLKAKGVSAECISLSRLMLETLRKLDCLTDSFLKEERSNRKIIFHDLERELPKEIASSLSNHLTGKDFSHCAILIRAGALFPFVHMSNLLSLLEGYVKSTLVIPYPGNREGEILNYRGESIKSYYRGEIININKEW